MVSEVTEEIVNLSEDIIKFSQEEDINLPDAVYYYLEDGPAKNHEWWQADNERKIEILQEIEKDFEIPEWYIQNKILENHEMMKDLGVKMKPDKFKFSQIDIPEASISAYSEDHKYYDMLFETVRWIIDDIVQGEYPDLLDPNDYFDETL